MRFRDVALLAGVGGVAAFAYGVLVESRFPKLERKTLALPLWPEPLRGYKIAVLGDLHLRGLNSVEIAQRAVALAIDAKPDMVAIVGDFVGDWRHGSPRMVAETLEPLLLLGGNVVAIPGNHDYEQGDVEKLIPVLDVLNIKLLRNESWRHDGITWVGVDSYKERMSSPRRAMEGVLPGANIALWHEPDLVGQLPPGCALQISGHSHGGQFRFPGGLTPVHTKFGSVYPRGFYPEAPTPLYVTRGVGTTLLPSRLLCPPEVSLLTLIPSETTAYEEPPGGFRDYHK